MSTAYLARWGTAMTDNTGSTIYAGPVTSASDPYTSRPFVVHESDHVSDSDARSERVFPAAEAVTLDNNAIKSALMTYGGVYTAFQWDETARSNRYLL